jgi:hypothetical protein
MLKFSWEEGEEAEEQLFVGQIDYNEAEEIIRKLIPAEFKVSKLQKRVKDFDYEPEIEWSSNYKHNEFVRLVVNGITVCCARYEIIGYLCKFESFSYTPIFSLIFKCYPCMFKSKLTEMNFYSYVSNELNCTHIAYIPPFVDFKLPRVDSLENLENIDGPVIFEKYYIQRNLFVNFLILMELMGPPSTDIEIGRSVTMAKELDWYYSGWKYSPNPTQSVPDALRPFFEIVAKASKIEKLDDFCDFVSKLLETSARESDKLVALKEIVGAETVSKDGPFTARMFKRLIKNREIMRDGDEKNEKLVKLINWCSKKVYVATSRVPNAGSGLFALKSFKKNDVICAYGGVLSNRNTNDYLNLQESAIDALNAYSLALGDDLFTFSGWIIDARRFFTVNETARWPNGFPWNDRLPVAPVYLKNGRIFNVEQTFVGNANLVIESDPYFPKLPRIVLQVTQDINAGAEIYANYGLNYAWSGIYWKKDQVQLAEPTMEELNYFEGPRMDKYGNMIADKAYEKNSIVTTYCSVSRNIDLTGVSEQQQKEYVFENTFYPLEPKDYRVIDKGRWIKIARDYRLANVTKVLKDGVALVKATTDIKAGTVLLYKSAFGIDTISKYWDLPRDKMMTKPYF